MAHSSPPVVPSRSPLLPACVAAAALAPFACGSPRRQDDGGRARPAADGGSLGGLYWGRFTDVPDGMRVQVWLDSDGARVRGAYTAVPFSGDLEGRVAGPGHLELTFVERGVTRALGSRARPATLRWNAARAALEGEDRAGARVELLRAGFPAPALRPGVWLSRWTGLPVGMAVETRIARDPDGHFRAVYQYQGTGGVRDGSFDGTLEPSGALTIRWQEVTESGQLARGRGRLLPTAFGLRGTFGIEGSDEGTGEWTLEPLGP